MKTSRLRELQITYTPHRSGALVAPDRALRTPQDAAAICVPMLKDQTQEIMVALLVDAKHRVIGSFEIARGGLSSVVVDPKVVFRAALAASAHGLILAHNHPSGDPTPSPDDFALTARLQAAGKLLEIEILDHLVIGDTGYCSFKETGRL